MINFQKYYLVHVGPFCPLWFYSFYIGPTRSNLSTLSYLVDTDPIWSTMVLFSPIWSYSVLLVPSQSTLVHFVLFSSLWSYSVLLVTFNPFLSIRSTLLHLVHLCSLWSIQTTSIHFDPLRSIFVHLQIEKRHVYVETAYSKFKFIYIYIYISNS